MQRRDFFVVAAAAAATPAFGSLGGPAEVGKIPTRKVGKVEIAFKSPTPQPNGIQCTDEGLWVMDQGPGSKASLVSYSDGKVIRQFETGTDRSSGITHDNGTLWIGSTYNRAIIRVDAKTGKTLEEHFTPGAGVIYSMPGDPPARSSPVPEDMRQPRPTRPGQGQGRSQAKRDPSQVGGFQAGRLLGPRALGTGAHGQEMRDGKLWMAVPPARMVFCVDPKEWVVEARFATSGNRPHGIGWEDRHLWVTDSNWNAFFKHDTETGQAVERIQLGEKDPLPHGMSIRDGWLWYCDDVGLICRLKLS
jgi:streptogramin lyase